MECFRLPDWDWGPNASAALSCGKLQCTAETWQPLRKTLSSHHQTEPLPRQQPLLGWLWLGQVSHLWTDNILLYFWFSLAWLNTTGELQALFVGLLSCSSSWGLAEPQTLCLPPSHKSKRVSCATQWSCSQRSLLKYLCIENEMISKHQSVGVHSAPAESNGFSTFHIFVSLQSWHPSALQPSTAGGHLNFQPGVKVVQEEQTQTQSAPKTK